MSSIEMETGSCLRGQNKLTLFFTQHLVKGSWRMKFVCTQPHRDLNRKKTLKSMHLHKRLWVVSFSIQLEREWTSTHTHIFNHPRADSSQSLLLLSEPHSLHVQLWRAKEEGTKSPLIKKAQWYHLVLTHKCYRFEVWPHQDVTHSVEGEGKITHKHTNK